MARGFRVRNTVLTPSTGENIGATPVADLQVARQPKKELEK
jgi:hypothetical protein